MSLSSQLTTVVSVGAGQDSTAIIYRIGLDKSFRQKYAPGRVLAIMSDTGDEHGETIKHVGVLARFCAEHDIEWVHLTFDMGYHSGPWANGLINFYETNNAIGSVAFAPTCSPNLKTDVIYRYLADRFSADFGGTARRKRSFYRYCELFGEPITVIIGIGAGEEKRIEKTILKACGKCHGAGCRSCNEGTEKPRSKWMYDCVRRVYPLVEIGWGRAECQAYISSIGRAVPPPSNCFACPFKSPDEILW
jgi:hypothetical protein